jgi:hypothetical protein
MIVIDIFGFFAVMRSIEEAVPMWNEYFPASLKRAPLLSVVTHTEHPVRISPTAKPRPFHKDSCVA